LENADTVRKNILMSLDWAGPGKKRGSDNEVTQLRKKTEGLGNNKELGGRGGFMGTKLTNGGGGTGGERKEWNVEKIT